MTSVSVGNVDVQFTNDIVWLEHQRFRVKTLCNKTGYNVNFLPKYAINNIRENYPR